MRYTGCLRSRAASSQGEFLLDIHLDPLGGLSGDMFVAALLDAFPEHWPHVQSTIASLNLGAAAECRFASHHDHSFAGSRFVVGADVSTHHPRAHSHSRHPSSANHEHARAPEGRGGHRAWVDIRAELSRSGLDTDVKKHAVAIFELLAEAEARVHGVEVDSVTFHE